MKAATARRVGLAGVLAASLVTAGCTAGQRAQTADEQETLDGTTAHLGAITIGGLAIAPPTSGSSWPAGGNVPVTAVFVNSGHQPDTLTSVTSPSVTSWSVSGSGGASGSTPKVVIPPNSRVQFGTGQTSGGTANQTLQLTTSSSGQPLYAGSFIKLTFRFQRAGSVTATVPVQITRQPQISVIPGPSATGQEG